MFKRKVCVILACCSLIASTGNAQQFKDFSAKRIKVGEISSKKRINVQILPQVGEVEYIDRPDLAPTAEKPPEVSETTADLQNWFWDAISPSLGAAAFDRLAQAERAMTKAPENGKAFRADPKSMLDIAKTYNKEILLASIDKRVSPAFILAMIAVESSGRSKVTSSAGAQGLMQLIPATAKRFNVSDPNDPQQNINGGTAYMNWLLDEFKGDPLLALAGYNAGENAVKQYQGVPPYPETRAYVPKVVAAWQVARSLCKTPPVLVSDGCVFSLN